MKNFQVGYILPINKISVAYHEFFPEFLQLQCSRILSSVFSTGSIVTNRLKLSRHFFYFCDGHHKFFFLFCKQCLHTLQLCVCRGDNKKNVISFSVKILFLFYLSLSNEKKYSSASQRQMLYTCKTQRNFIKKN